MTIEDEAYEEAEDLADQIGVAIEFAIMGVIASRLGKITPETTISDTIFYETVDLAAIEEICRRGRKAVERAANISLDKLDKINQEWAKPYFEARKALPPASGAIDRAKKDASSRASQLIRTSVIGIVDDNGKAMKLARGYRKAISNAVTMMKSGEAVYEHAVRHTVKQLSRFGVRVEYQSGYQRELQTAVRTNIMDAYDDAMMEQRNEMGEAFGADGVEITAHYICAKDHQDYQGQSFTKKDFEDIQSNILRARPIETGANCRHRAIPIIIGIGRNAYSQAQLEDMRRNSNEIITFKGMGGNELSMTRYEATQYQRNVEREIRRSKGEARLLDDANLPNFGKMAHQRSRDLTSYYKGMSKETGLDTRMERTRLYQM